MAFDAGGGSEKVHDFRGKVVHWHIDGQHIFVEFETSLREGQRTFDVGYYDRRKSPELKRTQFEAGTKVKGIAEIIDSSNAAIIQTLEKIPRPKLKELAAKLFAGKSAQEK